MPLGDALAEFSTQITSLDQTEIGGGLRRIEISASGEATGQLAGQMFVKIVAEATPSEPSPFNATGSILTTMGSVIQFNAYGVGTLGDGFQIHLRGADRQKTAETSLAAMNNATSAVEGVIDLKGQTLKGKVYLWP